MKTFAFYRCARFVGALATLTAWDARPEKRHA